MTTTYDADPEGRCSVCRGVYRLTVRGQVRDHLRYTSVSGSVRTLCPGSGRAPEPLSLR